MKKIVEGKIYVAPNGNTKVKIYPHGFIEPVGEIPKHQGDIIKLMSKAAAMKLGKDATPFQVFEFMGWVEDLES